MSDIFRPGDRVLFQGDSITDCGRRNSADGLGNGYVAMVRAHLAARRPGLGLEVLNRGVSGDRTAELLGRWDADCLALAPQVLSLMIGVNDVWRKLGEWNGQTHIALPQYQANLCQLLDRAQAAGVRQLVLVSPTTIEPDNDGELNRLLADYDRFVQEEAGRRQAVYVPARRLLMDARRRWPEVVWTTDGCHPTVAGHALLAEAWERAVGLV